MRDSRQLQGLNRVASAAVVATALGTPAIDPVAPAIASLELRDQNGGTDSVAAHKGHAFVAFAVDARKLRKVKAWEVALRKTCPDVRSIRIADVPRSPATTHEAVAAKLRGRVPADVPVLIDIEGTWAQALRLDTSEVNAIVFDRDGTPSGPVHGRRDDTRVARLRGALVAAGGCGSRDTP